MLTPLILEDVSVTETIMFNAKQSKNYGSPTRVTRLKVTPNMANPISIKDSDSRLKIIHEIYLAKPHKFQVWSVTSNRVLMNMINKSP